MLRVDGRSHRRRAKGENIRGLKVKLLFLFPCFSLIFYFFFLLDDHVANAWFDLVRIGQTPYDSLLVRERGGRRGVGTVTAFTVVKGGKFTTQHFLPKGDWGVLGK